MLFDERPAIAQDEVADQRRDEPEEDAADVHERGPELLVFGAQGLRLVGASVRLAGISHAESIVAVEYDWQSYRRSANVA
ncbi:hypothetical protein GCM10025780_05780 [Frondihabitans cladoniiphilus]|uniref:Uncharacterized protein n=1 Tax=Frondihabitans cladoniiphilus TaxID=715785 RepID=A0ABP8VNS0_9MICO